MEPSASHVHEHQKKQSRRLLVQIGMCLLGIVLSFVVFAVCIQINFFLPSRYDNPARLLQIAWRIEYLFSPVVVTLVSLTVSVLDRTRYKLFLVVIAVLPFVLFQLAANSFSAHALLFAIVYLAIASLASLLIPNRQPRA